MTDDARRENWAAERGDNLRPRAQALWRGFSDILAHRWRCLHLLFWKLNNSLQGKIIGLYDNLWLFLLRFLIAMWIFIQREMVNAASKKKAYPQELDGGQHAREVSCDHVTNK